MIKKVFLTLLILSGLAALTSSVYATSTCGRTAIIEQQEVLIDTTPDCKGSGLKEHLEKDPLAKSYLDEYQRRSQNIIPSAIIGTTGALVTASSLFVQNSSNNRQSLFLAGISILFINFLVTKTLEVNNEKLLDQAVSEYNKRNLPTIRLAPIQNDLTIPLFQLNKDF